MGADGGFEFCVAVFRRDDEGSFGGVFGCHFGLLLRAIVVVKIKARWWKARWNLFCFGCCSILLIEF